MHKKNSSLLEPSRVEGILADANRCVSCGLCLPHCPTYRLTLSEADSPRGRIAMISGVASQRIPMNARFNLHMDRCLTCRACEVACPNHVAYGRLIDEARALTLSTVGNSQAAAETKKRWFRQFVERAFIEKPQRMDVLRPLVHFLQKIGLQSKVQHFSIVKGTKLSLLLANLPLIRYPYRKWRKTYPAIGRQRGKVALFLGCVARLVDIETNLSAIFVLNKLGYTVHVPKSQTCCGAIYQHSGRIAEAADLIRRNKKVFGSLDIDAIITTASGCGAQLTEQWSQQQTENMPAPIVDINKFLAEQDWSDVKFAALSKRVAVHEPCTMRNVLRASQYPYRLLENIPGIEIVPLAGNNVCCGAAGTYFIDQPEIAELLLNEKMTALDGTDANYLVTSNIGCLLHLASGLKDSEKKIEVLHPVTLLARQISILQ